MSRTHHGTKPHGVNRRRIEPIEGVIRRIEVLSDTMSGPAIDDAMRLVAEIRRLRSEMIVGTGLIDSWEVGEAEGLVRMSGFTHDSRLVMSLLDATEAMALAEDLTNVATVLERQ